MTHRERLVELLGSMQRDLLPSLMRMHEQDNLRLIDAVVLQVVDRRDKPTVKQIAALIDRSTSRTSRLIDRLVKRGLLSRSEDTTDRRIKRIRIDKRGRAVIDRMQLIRADATVTLLEALTAEEQAEVMAAMELLATAARRVHDERDPSV